MTLLIDTVVQSRESEPRALEGEALFSVVVPVHNGAATLGRCLASVNALRGPRFELLVVDDGSSDGSAEIAVAAGARVIRQARQGPAAARNRGALEATGTFLFFLDADCEIHPDALELAAEDFAGDPSIDALFGSYDDRPAARGLVSTFKNLFHHWTHQRGAERAGTFWAGCGAIRRERFEQLRGFDALRYAQPSIEDIELGYRLTESGGTIRLDRRIQACHLKRWTLAQMVRTDILQRGVPWTELLLERRGRADQLNVGRTERVITAVGALGVLALPLAAFAPQSLALTALAVLALVASSRGLYALMWRRRGAAGALAAVPLHALYCCCCCAAFALGLARGSVASRKKLVLGS